VKCFKIIDVNIRSILGKFDGSIYYVNILKPNIICLNESWLTSDIDNNEIYINGYELFRYDRVIDKSGSIAIYVQIKSSLSYEVMPILDSMEELTIKLKFIKSKCFYLSCIYRPSNDSHFIDKYTTFFYRDMEMMNTLL
jgi:hypothetical protein